MATDSNAVTKVQTTSSTMEAEKKLRRGLFGRRPGIKPDRSHSNELPSRSFSSPSEEHRDRGLRGRMKESDVRVFRCLYLRQASCTATAAHVRHPGE
ncbi:hypothetical protein GW17_00047467 [Ensete ventricosum]|nr:hypothetical protein GW17_00047467 [Ensete ventricosum]